jgi:hypothetical protein
LLLSFAQVCVSNEDGGRMMLQKVKDLLLQDLLRLDNTNPARSPSRFHVSCGYQYLRRPHCDFGRNKLPTTFGVAEICAVR